MYALSFGTTQLNPQFARLIGSDWAGVKKIIDDVSQARQQVSSYDGEFKTECESVCDYWLAYAERHQINAFCTAYLKQAKESIAPLLRFPLVWPPEEPALTTDELRSAAGLVATIHKDLKSETFKKIPEEARAPLEIFDKRLSELDPVLRGLVSPNGNLIACSISMAGSRVPTNPGPPSTRQTPVPRIPDVTYELRAGTPVSGTHANLGRQGKVRLGEARLFIDRLPIDTVFHFHRYDPQKREVHSGPNWCALRLLVRTTQTSPLEQNGVHWDIRIDETHPDAIVNIVFENTLPKLRDWPTKQSVLSTN